MMRKTTRFSSWMCFLALVSLPLGPPLSFATTFYPQAFPETVQKAPVIVRGKIGAHYSDWSKDGDGTRRIYTFYELQVTEIFKGNASPSTLTIRELGGEKDGVGLQIAGTSQYETGEDVVVFLRDKNPDGTFDVQGMMMGKYNLQTDSNRQEYLVGPGILSGSRNDADQPAGGPKKWTLPVFRQLIQSQAPSTAASPTPTLLPSPTASPNLEPSPSAPQLQPPAREEPQSPKGSLSIPAIGIGALGVLGMLWGILRMNRRKRQ
jgi:hypothetical protein